ncbi:DUF3087 domain-containing protein [Stutzerimonas kunmingensis]|uniref:DUF3087 domain-containing protein n=1 Tax=Stutzerimonas kunmingensis TaxID=1211807 RepID=UPI00241C5B1B|nr:DUF3087 domain-containing protein [Stutzerimonas kunmingensis]
MVLFEIVPLSPETYRQQTRRSTLIVAATFAVLAMGLSTLAVALFGEPGGDNLRLNIIGVVAGLALTIGIVRWLYWQQPWMAAAVYGWQLKRSLMRVTNMMHQVKAGVSAGDPDAMKLLRFYHLGLTQMHRLDGNSSGLSDSVAEIDLHREAMEARSMDTDQPRLESGWLERVGQIEAKR